MSRRSPWVVLAVLSLVGSLLALSAAPSAGKNGEADYPAQYSACLGNALEPAGFRDVAGYPRTFEDAINCMANYGVMPGLSPGLFRPDLEVTRQQMALILIRAAGPAGIDVPNARDQGFRDIDDLPREVRDSINQLAQLRITLGTTVSTYTPDTVVNRRQMAQFFTRFLALAEVGEGGTAVESVVPDDTVFEDIDNLPHDPYDAIRLLYELGVTTGTTATTYGPDLPVTRAQMALFISRMLAHTDARPVGLTMQVEETSVTAGDTVELIISVRDEDHVPVPDAPVDLFYVAEGDDGFVSGGRCGSKAVREEGDFRCQIDGSDESTDGDGNLYYTMEIDESLTVYAWTGDRNDEFDIDSTDHAALRMSTSKSAAFFLITDDMPDGAVEVPYGTVVTVTFQLVDEDEKPVQEEEVEIRISITEDNGGRSPFSRKTYETDSLGRVEIPLRLRDPDSRDDGDDGDIRVEVLDSDVPPRFKTTVRATPGDIVEFVWSDADGDATTVQIDQRFVYSEASDSGSSNRVTATVLDQYGDPVRRQQVQFTSDDPNGLWHVDDDDTEARRGFKKSTSSRGAATVTYTRRSGDMGVEEICVRAEDIANPVCENHYWVEEFPDDDTPLSGKVRYHDSDEDTLVIVDASNNVYVVTYDENDWFLIPGRVGYREFKAELAEKDAETPDVPYSITVSVKGHDADDVNSFEL